MNRPNDFFNFTLRVSVLLSLLAVEARGDDNRQTLTFERAKLQVSKVSGYDIVRYGDVNLSQEISAPQLPECVVHLVLPPGKDIAAVTITALQSDTLDGKYDLFPVQPPQVLSNPNIQFRKPDREIYSSADPFPKDILRIAPQGYFSGYSVGALVVYPVQYIPLKKMLIFHSEIQVQVTYKNTQRYPLPFKETMHSASIQQKAVKEMVENPSSMSRPTFRSVQSVSLLPDEEHEYVLITGDGLVGSFQPLCDWNLRKGLSAKIVTTSWITSNYSGIDSPEKIRNFIRDAHEHWGTLWVLLGGDVDIVPPRYAYAMDCQYGSPSDNYIPCDLYYSDLDGNWNANGNDTSGEVADNVDMYPDVFVGRASVENQSEADAFVNKLLTYEKNPPTDYECRGLFLAQVLWGDPYTNSGLGKNYIDSMYIPPRFDPITKLYQDLGNESRATAIPALNAGPSFVNHDGHAWSSVIGLGNEYLEIADMDALTNGPRYSILYSIGCWPASFDYDCIAEHFIKNPNGGGVAFIGNSRYGWGSPGNPLYGYSDRFDQQFFKKLFQDNIYHIGNTLAAAKAVFVPLARQENVYRWCEYEVNLLGDPEMPVWTDTPRQLTVVCPSALPVGTTHCPVAVSDGSTSIAGALVCLMQDSVVYTTGLTGPGGRVDLEISTSNPSRPLHLTVTAQNFLPLEKTVSLVAQGPYVSISSYSTNGSAAGFVAPGDSVSMDLCLKNFGSDPAGDLSILLRSEDQKITLVDSTASAGVLLSGDSLVIPGAFSFRTDTAFHNSEVARLNVVISDTAGDLWSDAIGLIGATPVVGYLQHQVSDSLLGNGNGFAEPGETVNVWIMIQNTGRRSAQNVTAVLRSSDPHIRIIDSTVGFGTVQSASRSCRSVRIAISDTCAVPSFPQIDMHCRTEDGCQSSDSFLVSVGIFGFSDDMENGGSKWTHSGGTDLWHLTSHRKRSGAASWYCGDEGQLTYPNNMSETLESMPVVIDRNSKLSFWCWYQFPNYGTDGVYVEANDGSGWTSLDFIGSGGALGSLVTWNTWLEYSYDLSRYPQGSSIRVRFRFVSDGSDVAEGVYIDDVKILKSQPDFVLPNESTIDVMQGWNMVSVPRIVSDSLKTAIFPSVSSFAYGYNGAYQQRDTLENGVGYWMKFTSGQTVAITGDPLLFDSIRVTPGWNLIGSISTPILAGSITSSPGGLETSPFWGYNGSYVCADTIEPGKGYWVKLGEAGRLLLSATGTPSARTKVRIVPSAELPPLPPDEALVRTGRPQVYFLEPNFPNPFNPLTTLRYQLPVDSRVTLTVYNVLGQAVKVLADGIQNAGYRSVQWNASDVGSGVYFYELRAINIAEPVNIFTQVRKMLLVR